MAIPVKFSFLFFTAHTMHIFPIHNFPRISLAYPFYVPVHHFELIFAWTHFFISSLKVFLISSQQLIHRNFSLLYALGWLSDRCLEMFFADRIVALYNMKHYKLRAVMNVCICVQFCCLDEQVLMSAKGIRFQAASLSVHSPLSC